MTLIRVCDSRVLVIICKTPHKMNCFNQRSGNDKKVVCRKAYNKNYYAKNREQILVRQKRYRTENPEILKSRRKRWYENNRERLASSQRAYCEQNKEHIRHYRRQNCKNNRERINKYWRSYYAKNKEQIKQRLRDQKQRKKGQNIVRFGGWDQESEKLETSLIPSDTLCGAPTVKT